MFANAIYGGIIGDMVGSIYEWKPCLKDKVYTFPLWQGSPIQFLRHESQRTGSRYTDDTVTGLAVADALLHIKDFSDDEAVKQAFISSMKEICPRYEWTGFGNRFWIWLRSPKSEPYNSWGNGSAMRVFPVGMMFDSLEKTRHIARLSAEITHNHSEGIKGAESVASVMYLARTGASKQTIKDYITKEYGGNQPFSYNLNRRLEDIRSGYGFYGSCQESVPESILCFLEGNSYEECIRLAVSLGGDSDTMGCITGAMAAMMYPIPKKMIRQAKLRMPKELHRIADTFEKAIVEKAK